jgi:diaminohydroxyphosphoribosylaminopyrimidine deaminase/5-amino-6-(5-phosphoribosylamino)uracil reductase
VRALRRAGIAVELGLEAEASRRLNEAYLKFMESGRPFVTLKLAQTLDGKIATRTGDAKWITSKASRRMARWMRADAQAIVVGARTVELDDPLLLSEPRRSANYVRCVLDSHLSIAPASRLARSAGRFPVIVYCAEERGLEKRRRRLEKMGVTVRPVKSVSRGMLDPGAVLADLGSMTVMHVWVEGGSAVFTSFLRAGLADKIVAFIATKLMGDGGSISVFGDLKVRKAEGCVRLNAGALECPGDDLLLALYPIPGQAATGRPARRAGVGVRRGRTVRVRLEGTGV